MIRGERLQRAVGELLRRGYQLEAEALELLKGSMGRIDPLQLVEELVRMKGMEEGGGELITKEEVKALLPQASLGEVEGRGDEGGGDEDEGEGEGEGEVTWKVIKDSEEVAPKEGIDGYLHLFRSRYRKLIRIAKRRPDARSLQPIASLKGEGVKKVGGLVMGKRSGKGSVELEVEDEGGLLKAVALEEGARRAAETVMEDQLVLLDIELSRNGKWVIRGLQHPDLPERAPNLSKKQVYALFLSDLHLGSSKFLKEAFEGLLAWLAGDDYLAKRTRYVVIGGDLVDGVGVYPGQEEDLEEPGIKEQYEYAAQLLSRMPKRVTIFISPGNHDAVRQSLPQPPIPRAYAEKLYSMGNVVMLGGPAYIELNGVKVLTYHGKSLDDVLATVPGLSYARPAEAMKLLLKARHLAPIYGRRTPLAPEEEDRLVIEEVPDIFHAGHVHTLDRLDYRGTLLLNSGTWQEQTRFQANMGIVPLPAKVPLVNLATLDVTVLDFR